MLKSAGITVGGAARGHQTADNGGDPVLEVFGQADPEVQPQGLRDLLGEVRAQRAPTDATDDLTDQPPVGQGVVAVGGTGLPQRLLFGQGRHDRVPGLDLLGAEGRIDGGEAGLMREQEEYGDIALSRLRELGPVGGHRRVEVELAPLGQQVGAGRGGTLGGGEDQLEGVLVVGSGPLAVKGAAVDVDHLVAAYVQAEGRPHLAPDLEVVGEGVPHPFEAGLDVPADDGVPGRSFAGAHAASRDPAWPIRKRKLST